MRDLHVTQHLARGTSLGRCGHGCLPYYLVAHEHPCFIELNLAPPYADAGWLSGHRIEPAS
jgi:hypothetical protein